jgi:apolipoprotein N-acyltransferase
MTYYITKLVITAALIVAISEISRRSSLMGAILASIPLVSVLAMFWLYIDTSDAAKVSALATGVFWLVIPSLALFVSLPLLLKNGMNFYLSMGISIVITIGCYFLMISVLDYYGIKL